MSGPRAHHPLREDPPCFPSPGAASRGYFWPFCPRRPRVCTQLGLAAPLGAPPVPGWHLGTGRVATPGDSSVTSRRGAAWPDGGWRRGSGGGGGGGARGRRELLGRKALALRSLTPAQRPAPPTPPAAAGRAPPATALRLRVPAAEAPMEPELCYVLDAVLFLYGIALTVLYCRLKFLARRASQGASKAAKEQKEEAIYTGLSTENQDTYEMLEPKS
ncbi:high affinity immunoglobulin epsilon receptor subunit gamma [Anser cygnoides]|uniref:high affinity immunoglobulin epsilon receptor subunit gamma n=1 Tax=Anser cygnoides TaxID=8845 RepID=UPI0034D20BA3